VRQSVQGDHAEKCLAQKSSLKVIARLSKNLNAIRWSRTNMWIQGLWLSSFIICRTTTTDASSCSYIYVQTTHSKVDESKKY